MNPTQKVVCLGEVMMRLSPPHHERFTQARQFEINFGGSEANVAVSLAHFGVVSEHVTRFPENDLGRSATAHLQTHHVSTDHIVYGDQRMGVYFVEHGADFRSSKVIYDRFNSAFSEINPSLFDWDDILKDASWFHWSGITPAISQGAADTCRQAIRTARKLGVKVSADINYRRNLWTYGKSAADIMPSLNAESDFIIGGLADFENCMNIVSSDFEDACGKIQNAFPAVSKIANTDRESVHSSHQKISSVLWSNKKLLRSKYYELTNIVDRIGAGDAFAAGLIFGFLNAWSDSETLEFAIAACALKHTVPGDVNRVTAAEVHALVKGENVGKLLR